MTSSGQTAAGWWRGLDLGRGRWLAVATFGIGVALVGLLLGLPNYARSVVPGHMVPGHEGVACVKCHVPAPGSMRQQVQANVMHWVGLRGSGASFGHEPVASASCSGCHAREDDRHPTFRFREPRFTAVNKTLDARNCLTCHSEHKAERVSNDGTFCAACHDGMKARKEVIQPTHADLSATKRWDTCLTCHDFHGNHPVKAPHRFEQAHDLAAVRAYLGSGADPYSPRKKHEARKEAEAGTP